MSRLEQGGCPIRPTPNPNPIEMLWLIERQLVTAKCKTEDEMFDEIERVWNELDQGMIDGL